MTWRIVVAAIALFALAVALQQPSIDREWSPDQRLLPRATIRGDLVDIQNVRNFEYRSETDFIPHYYSRTYDLRKLDSVWFVVERLKSLPGGAHTFLTFGFGDSYVAISVEIRKERGETYSPLRGLMRQYELMYVIADERDVIGVRTNWRRDEVQLYPVRTTRERMRRVFLDMVQRANDLAEHPEFYNTLTNTCTTNIVRHVNTITPNRVPFSPRVLLPAYSDSLAYELGMIDSPRPLKELRAAYRIDRIAQGKPIDDDFSQRIRSAARRPPAHGTSSRIRRLP